jgi:thioredoxin:protein disulfide reductase
MFKRLFKLFCIALASFVLQASAKEFLKPEEAFQISAILNQQELVVSFKASAGYYMYQESMQVSSAFDGKSTVLKPNVLPPAIEKYDENFQKIVRTYKGDVQISFLTQQLPQQTPLNLEVQVQGCAEKGICYPPMTRYVQVTQYDTISTSVGTLEEIKGNNSNDKTSWWQAKDDLNALNRILEKTSTPVLLGIFFLLGLGLAFTPCMLPMLPILSSILFGFGADQKSNSRVKTVTTAGTYVLGMALAFSLAGMATAGLGAGVSVYLQNPIVVIGFGLLMMILSASLLGFFELRLPYAWNQMVNEWMNQHQGGSLFGVFILGALSSLIASPCVTAPLAGVLTFIAQSGKVELGGLILFVLALGMGIPLMLFAIGARSLVPKAGSWMIRVQRVLALVLIIFALWMVYPAITSLINGHAQQTTKEIGGLAYQVVAKEEDLRIVLNEAIQTKTPLLLNYSADWCVSCKEIEQTMLSNPEVIAALKDMKRVEVDVTASGKNQQMLLNKYQLFGPPAFIFIQANGQELANAKIVGLSTAEKMLEKLRLLRTQ